MDLNVEQVFMMPKAGEKLESKSSNLEMNNPC